MRLAADENCDFLIVLGLHNAGHDVVAITEMMSGAEDEAVIDLANSQKRLLLIEDKDFGRLVFAATKQNSGVLLIRYLATARSSLIADILKLLADRGPALYGCFVVLQPGRARIISIAS